MDIYLCYKEGLWVVGCFDSEEKAENAWKKEFQENREVYEEFEDFEKYMEGYGHEIRKIKLNSFEMR